MTLQRAERSLIEQYLLGVKSRLSRVNSQFAQTRILGVASKVISIDADQDEVDKVDLPKFTRGTVLYNTTARPRDREANREEYTKLYGSLEKDANAFELRGSRSAKVLESFAKQTGFLDYMILPKTLPGSVSESDTTASVAGKPSSSEAFLIYKDVRENPQALAFAAFQGAIINSTGPYGLFATIAPNGYNTYKEALSLPMEQKALDSYNKNIKDDVYKFSMPEAMRNLWSIMTTEILESVADETDDDETNVTNRFNAISEFLKRRKDAIGILWNFANEPGYISTRLKPEATQTEVMPYMDQFRIVSYEKARKFGWFDGVVTDDKRASIAERRVLLANPTKNTQADMEQMLKPEQYLYGRMFYHLPRINATNAIFETLGQLFNSVRLIFDRMPACTVLCTVLKDTMFKQTRRILDTAMNVVGSTTGDPVSYEFSATVDWLHGMKMQKREENKNIDIIVSGKPLRSYFFFVRDMQAQDVTVKAHFQKFLLSLQAAVAGIRSYDFAELQERFDSIAKQRAEIDDLLTTMSTAFEPLTARDLIGEDLEVPATPVDSEEKEAAKKVNEVLENLRNIYKNNTSFDISPTEYEEGKEKVNKLKIFLSETLEKKLAEELKEFECAKEYAAALNGSEGLDEFERIQSVLGDPTKLAEMGSLQMMATEFLEAFDQVARVEMDNLLVLKQKEKLESLTMFDVQRLKALNLFGGKENPQPSLNDEIKKRRSATNQDEDDGDDEGPIQAPTRVPMKPKQVPMRVPMKVISPDSFEREDGWSASSAFAARRELQQFFAASRQMPRLPSTPSVLTSLFASSLDSRLALGRRGRAAAATGIPCAATQNLKKGELDPFFELVTEEFKKGAVYGRAQKATLFDAIVLQARGQLADQND